MALLAKAGDATLIASEVRVTLRWVDSDDVHDIDLSALLVGADGLVREESDFVFYNQPTHPSGTVRHEGRDGTADRLVIVLGSLPADVDRVVLAGSIADSSFDQVQGLTLSVTSTSPGVAEQRHPCAGDGSDTARVVGEIYRQNGTWRLRAGGRSWSSGLAGLVTSYGVKVDGSAAESVEASQATEDSSSRTIGDVDAEVAAPGPTPAPTPEERPEATDARPVEAPRSSLLRQRRVTARAAPPHTATLGTGPIALRKGQSVHLERSRSRAAHHVWLRITCAGDETAVSADVSALTYDAHGTLQDVVDYAMPGLRNGSLGLTSRTVVAKLDPRAAVEIDLDAATPATAGILVAVTCYRGDSLAPLGPIATELIDANGAVLATTECTDVRTSGALLVRLTRVDDGGWFMTALADGVSGRSAKSLVGAGHWALNG